MRVADPADEDVIRVVPRAGMRIGGVPGVAEADAVKSRKSRAPFQTQIAGRAPAMADFAAPFPDLTHAVLAEVEDDVPIQLLKFIPHLLVRFLEMLERVAAGNR